MCYTNILAKNLPMEIWKNYLYRIITIGFCIIFPIIYAYYRKERILALRREAHRNLQKIKAGTLPIVLYLRDFDADQRLELIKFSLRYGITVEMPIDTYELRLMAKLRSIGGLYAIRNNIIGDSMVGPSTESFDDENWQAAVLDAMEKARLILYRPSGSKGTFWEFTQIVERGYLAKTLLIIKKGLREPDGSDMYDGFREHSLAYIPQLPDLKYHTTYMWFETTEKCHIASGINQVPLYIRHLNTVKRKKL